MQNMNLSQDKMNALLRMAGQKLGKSPEQLRSSIEQGNLNQVIGGLDPQQQAKVNALLQNPKALESLLGNEKLKSLMAGLGGK